MSQFLVNSTTSGIHNLAELVVAADPRSDQVLMLTSSIKARDDCLLLIEQKFSDGDMNFEQVIKALRKVEEDKFMDRALLNKCIGSA